jgi:hypothetical protein
MTMRKRVWSGWLIIVHAALVWFVWHFVWVRAFGQGLPVRFRWLVGAAAVSELGLTSAQAGAMIDGTEIGLIQLGHEQIGALIFRKRVLEDVIIRWAGETAELSLQANSTSLLPAGGVLMPSPLGAPDSIVMDRDGDRVFDTEERSNGAMRERWRYERILLWRHDRVTGVCEVMGRSGGTAARVSPDPEDNTMLVVERLEAGRILAVDRIPRSEYNLGDLVRELNPER